MKQKKRISTDKGILLRMNRSIQVEGAFGVLKQDYGFRRFLTRGKTNNETRLFILAIAFNIRKLCSRLADGRFGKALFEPKTAWNNLPRTTKLEQVCLPYTKITLSAWAGFAWAEKCNVRHSTDCPPKKRKVLLQIWLDFATAPFSLLCDNMKPNNPANRSFYIKICKGLVNKWHIDLTRSYILRAAGPLSGYRLMCGKRQASRGIFHAGCLFLVFLLNVNWSPRGMETMSSLSWRKRCRRLRRRKKNMKLKWNPSKRYRGSIMTAHIPGNIPYGNAHSR